MTVVRWPAAAAWLLLGRLGQAFGPSCCCKPRRALCRSSLEPDAAGAFDWVTATDPEHRQFGWWQTSIPDVNDPKYRIVDQMYLLQTTDPIAATAFYLLIVVLA